MTSNSQKHSAGLLMYRVLEGVIEVFLAHPGGPYYARKDAGAWTIPKGELQAGEEPLACAVREFEEETGMPVAAREFLVLGEVRQRGGKLVQAWAFAGAEPPPVLRSNMFEIEWPPRSGRLQRFPEVDRADFFSLERARSKINPAQQAFLDRLQTLLEMAPHSSIRR